MPAWYLKRPVARRRAAGLLIAAAGSLPGLANADTSRVHIQLHVRAPKSAAAASLWPAEVCIRAIDGEDKEFERTCFKNKSATAKGERLDLSIRPADRPPKGKTLDAYLFDDQLYLWRQPTGMLAVVEKGFYAESTTALPISSQASGVLELTRDSETYAFRLPGDDTGAPLKWHLSSSSGAQLALNGDGTLALTGSPKSVAAARLVATGGGQRPQVVDGKLDDTAAVLRPRDQQMDPADTQVLDAEKLAFHWSPGELYDPPMRTADCPSAVLVATSRACPAVAVVKAAPTGDRPAYQCAYTCDVGSDAPLSLPTKLRFSKGIQGDEWEDTLARIDQEFRSSPNRDQREFPVKLPWDEDPPPGAPTGTREACGKDVVPRPTVHRLKHVELFAADGKTFYIPLDDTSEGNATRIRVPGLVARDQLSYRYWGYFQNYESARVQLECGAFWLPGPAKTFQELWVGARMSLGLLAPLRLAVPSQVRPAGEIEAVAQVRIYDHREAFELAASYIFGEKEYRPLGIRENDETRHSLFVNRLLFPVRVTIALAEPIQAVLGAGGMLEFPAEDSKADLMETIGGAALLEGGLRWTPKRVLTLQLGARLILPERVRDFQPRSAESGFVVPGGGYQTPTFKNDVGVLFLPAFTVGLWGPP